jgi:hypothetical protein
MNELQTKVITWLESAAQKIGEFASKEVPPFIHEYLQWKFFETCSNATVPIIFLIISYYVLHKGIKLAKSKKADSGEDVALVMTGVIGTILSLIAVATVSFTCIKTAAQIKIAPKVYLIERASELIKENK